MSRLVRRSANYTTTETECLLSHLEANTGLLDNKLGEQFKTAEEYWQAWDELGEKITEAGGYLGEKRSGRDIKRKWTDLKHRVKSKVASIAMEDEKHGGASRVKLTPTDERVLTLMSMVNDIQSGHYVKKLKEIKAPALRVFSFQNDSNSQQGVDDSSNQGEGDTEEMETKLVSQIKSNPSEDKKRRLSEAFNSSNAERSSAKRSKQPTDEEQLLELCASQKQVNIELCTIKDILKKCQLSIEKLALLKRAELRLKCAKYGVEFDDLFD